MFFVEVLKQVKLFFYEIIIFDIVLIGYIFCFFQFFFVLEKVLKKILQFFSQFGGVLNGFLGVNGVFFNGQNFGEMMEKFEVFCVIILEVNQ